MKYLLFFIIGFNYLLNAGISLDYNCSDGLIFPVNLENSGSKNVIVNYYNNTLELYNEDYTTWKVIDIPVPTGYSINFIYNITESLFDIDAQVEFFAGFYKTDDVSSSYYGGIVKEDGTFLLEVPDCYSIDYGVFGEVTKLYVYKTSYQNGYYIYSSQVYSLPGSVDIDEQNDISSINIDITSYPNPGNGFIDFKFDGNQVKEIKALYLFNSIGQKVSSFNLNGENKNLSIDTGRMPSGLYFYNLENTSGTIIGKGKFNVIK
ncbi:MAG: T9SS type A sorting domain-containing protein [Candidatus Delongbacteria bacterium]|nr:T9SS type A sorting domain-containing protein [Candidatus Delongbacteria bacterium]MBN2836616.1 T9SS type A sorting domain-containing protein [Candidatus Delongbacteria bacterium]